MLKGDIQKGKKKYNERSEETIEKFCKGRQH